MSGVPGIPEIPAQQVVLAHRDLTGLRDNRGLPGLREVEPPATLGLLALRVRRALMD